MAVSGGSNWSTADYFDPFPGMAVADRRRQMAEQKRLNSVQEARAAEAARMQQAEALGRMGVDPIMGPQGNVDWNATVQAARVKQVMGERAKALASLHAWAGGPATMTPEEESLTKLPEYQDAYRMVSAVKAQQDAKQAAIMEQIGARAAAKAAPTATVFRKLPDGSSVRIPVDPQQAMEMGDKGEAPQTQDKWQEAIDSILRFQGAGIPIDVETDKEGFPKVEKSSFWHDASPSNPKSYDKQIENIRKRQGAKEQPVSKKAGKMIVIPR